MEAQLKYLSPDVYLDIERDAELRSEYDNGEIYAMAGASEKHNVIAGNTFSALHAKLRQRKCTVYQNDMRLRIEKFDKFVYPDIMVVCGDKHFYDDEFDTLLNPIIIIEILSTSTESYDRGQKFAAYRSIPSLQEYVLISQEDIIVERFQKNGDGFWVLSDAVDLAGVLELDSIELQVALSDIYEDVEFISR